jgi:hypothetical protein
MAEIKTKATTASVTDFIDAVESDTKRADSYTILRMMEKATGEQPKMWGTSIIGFGEIRVKSPTSGREVDWFQVGFSPRKANLTLYLCGNVARHAEALKILGKHKTGGGCLYINKLSDVDLKVLEGMIKEALKHGYF